MVSSFWNAATRLDGICPYFTRFPLSFPHDSLANASPGEWVLDPFCGCGTTLLAGRMRGVNAFGMDVNPVATVISKAKIIPISAESVISRASTILANSAPACPVSCGPFWERCFNRHVLEALCRFRAHFSNSSVDHVDIVLCAMLMGILHGPGGRGQHLSAPMPASFAPSQEALVAYWDNMGYGPPDVDMTEILSKCAWEVFAIDLPEVKGYVHRADSQEFGSYDTRRYFDWVVTSPPYFGFTGFQSSQWLRLWVMGMEPDGDHSVPHSDLGTYTKALSRVWRNCSRVGRPGTTMFLRLGVAAPRSTYSTVHILESSLQHAGNCWEITESRPLPRLNHADAQENPFPAPTPYPVDEYIFTLVRSG